MATPTLRAIFEHSGGEELLLIGRHAPVELLRGAPFAKNFLKFKPQSRTPGTLGRRRQLVQALKARKLDAIVLFPIRFPRQFWPIWPGVPRRIGYIRDCRGLM